MFFVNKIDAYLAKRFLLCFLQIIGAFSILIFFINFIDSLSEARSSNVSVIIAIEMAFLRIPVFLDDIVSSLILISAIITFTNLSSRSEITIMRIGGLSLWQVIKPISLIAFILGIFWILVFNPMSIDMIKASNDIERLYINKESRDVFEPKNGIWFRQDNKENDGEEIIIQAKKVYKDKIELNRVKLLFFDKNGLFYKKINSQKMILNDGYWFLSSAIINDKNYTDFLDKDTKIPTDLKVDFIKQKIVNNFQNVKTFSIFSLPSLINDLELSGFSSTKFKVRFYSLLSKPFLFLSMIFIACYFGLNHIRNQSNALMIFLGIISGLIIYILSTILESIGSSGIIPNFAATWMVVIICLSLSVLMVYNKEG